MENGVEDTQERTEAVSEAEDVSMSGLEEKLLEMAPKVPGGQNVVDEAPKAQKRKKWPWILLIVMLLVGVGVGLAIWQPWRGPDEAEDVVVTEDEDGGDEQDKVNEEVSHDVVTLSVDDSLVQEIFRRFGGETLARSVGLTDFYQNGGAQPENMVGMAMNNLLNQVEAGGAASQGLDLCRVTHLAEGFEIAREGYQECFSGERLRQTVQELFGRSVELGNEEKQVFDAGSVWVYDPKTDEVYFDGGKSGFTAYVRALYGAERDDERLYLYEVAVMPQGWGCGALEPGEICKYSRIDGTEVIFGADPTEKELIQRKDELDNFKWTFQKNGAGDYVFERLEKL